MPPRPHATRGFTLVELLVVIGIIAILIAVGFPAYNAALTHARTTKCSANLRTLGIGMISFAGDNNGQFPESGGGIEWDQFNQGINNYGWMQQIETYVGGGKESPVYQCPDSSRVIGVCKYYSYFNGAHAAIHESGNFGPVSIVKVRAPTAHILAGDIAFPNGFAVGDCDKDDYTQDPAFNGNNGKIPIHGGTVNILFVDGHIENLKKFDKTSMTTTYEGPGLDYLAQ